MSTLYTLSIVDLAVSVILCVVPAVTTHVSRIAIPLVVLCVSNFVEIDGDKASARNSNLDSLLDYCLAFLEGDAL